MPQNKLSDLRNHLFATLEALRDEEKPMELERAKTIAQVANAVIASAKVEVDMVRAVNAFTPASSDFFGMKEESRELPKTPRIEAAARRLA